MTPSLRSAPRAPILLFLSALFLASCEGDPSLFEFADAARVLPEIWYDSGERPLEELSTVRAWAVLPLRYESWPLRWTTDAQASIHETEKWKDYDPDAGILLFSPCSLRVFAGNPEGSLITGVALKEFPLRETASVSYFVAPGGTGDGLSPESPLGSVQEAVNAAGAQWAAAGSSGPSVLVRVQGGLFQESLSLKPGVDLEGSYGPSWEPPSFPSGWSPGTRILAPVYNGSTATVTDPLSAEPSWALRLDSGMGASRILAITFQGHGAGLYGSALLADCPALVEGEAVLSFDHCRFEAGGAVNSAAAWLRGGSSASGIAFHSCEFLSSPESMSSQALVMGILSLDASIFLSGESLVNSGPPAASPSLTENEVYGIRARRASSGAPQPLLVLRDESVVKAKGNSYTRLALGLDADGAILETEGPVGISSGGAEANGGDSTGISCGLRLWSALGLESSAVLRGGDFNGGWAGDRYGSAPGSQPSFDPSLASFSAGILILDGASLDVEGAHSKGGDVPFLSAGLVARGRPGNLRISGSTLMGGSTGGGFSAGIVLSLDDFSAEAPDILIESSRIWGGAMKAGGGYLRGLWAQEGGDWSADLVLRNCLIHAGRPNFDPDASVWSGSPSGIVLQAATSGGLGKISLLNDTVLALRGDASIDALGLEANVSPELVNCVFLSDGRAVVAWPSSAAARPSSFWNNILFSALGSHYMNEGAVSLTQEELNDQLASNPVTGRADSAGGNLIGSSGAWPASILEGSGGPPLDEESFFAFDFRPPSGFVEGGMNLSASQGFSTDLLGRSRVVPWSQGAFEKP